MSIEIRREAERIICVKGEIDLSNVEILCAAIDKVIESRPRSFIIDLSEATYLDSSAIAAIMSAYKRISRHGKLALVAQNDNIRQMLELIQVDRLPCLLVFDNLASAKRELAK